MASGQESEVDVPLVDENDNEIDIMKPWSLQSESAQLRTLEQIEMYRDELLDEFGATFTTNNLWTGRVLIEFKGQEPYVAYLSDESSDGRLVIDDLTFEIWEEWLTPASVQPLKPTPLGEL